MDDTDIRCGQEEQCCTQLLSKLSCEVERYPTEICVSQKLIQVIRQKLKHETQVVTKHEVALQANCMQRVWQ